MDVTTFGDWLKRQRRLKRLTQAELEKRSEIGHSHMSKIENGHIALPEADTRERIHRVLGTGDDDLVAAGILVKYVADGDTVYIARDAVGTERAAGTAPVPDTDLDAMRIMIETGDLTEREAGELLGYLDFIRKRSERR